MGKRVAARCSRRGNEEGRSKKGHREKCTLEGGDTTRHEERYLEKVCEERYSMSAL
jgi:hypothetical protein